MNVFEMLKLLGRHIIASRLSVKLYYTFSCAFLTIYFNAVHGNWKVIVDIPLWATAFLSTIPVPLNNEAARKQLT
jgi:hypothetical protein